MTYAADIDPGRCETARQRLPGAVVHVADVAVWPFPDCVEPVAVADFDAYGNPYPALESFWRAAPKAPKLVIFGTDGMRLRSKRAQVVRSLPDGAERKASLNEMREALNYWWPRYVRPWLVQLILPGRIVSEMHYERGQAHMLYWGMVVER